MTTTDRPAFRYPIDPPVRAGISASPVLDIEHQLGTLDVAVHCEDSAGNHTGYLFYNPIDENEIEITGLEAGTACVVVTDNRSDD